jgi:hypothetical protein
LTYNIHCVRTIPPECTAIDLSSLEWTLHGNHDYYVTIKVTNLAGLTTTHTSVVYTHDVQPPSPGVVLDINPTNIGNRQLQVSTVGVYFCDITISPSKPDAQEV